MRKIGPGFYQGKMTLTAIPPLSKSRTRLNQRDDPEARLSRQPFPDSRASG
jgi:hypothetical protein